jgi:hypothetical protein
MKARFGPVGDSPCWLQRRLQGSSAFGASLFAALGIATPILGFLALLPLLEYGTSMLPFLIAMWVAMVVLVTTSLYMFIRGKGYTREELQDYVVMDPPGMQMPRVITVRSRFLVALLIVAGTAALISSLVTGERGVVHPAVIVAALVVLALSLHPPRRTVGEDGRPHERDQVPLRPAADAVGQADA